MSAGARARARTILSRHRAPEGIIGQAIGELPLMQRGMAEIAMNQLDKSLATATDEVVHGIVTVVREVCAQIDGDH